MTDKTKSKAKRGLFIVFEGIDGSGKTTQARRLHQHFADNNVPVFLTKEPSESPTGLRIRELLISGSASLEELSELFLEDRKQHIEQEIVPALESGKHVICDRYYHSNIAYQGASGLDVGLLQQRNGGFLKPDLIFFFRLQLDLALRRVNERNEAHSIFEKRKFLGEVAGIYESIFANESNACPIDAEGNEEEIHREVCGFFSRKRILSQ